MHVVKDICYLKLFTFLLINIFHDYFMYAYNQAVRLIFTRWSLILTRLFHRFDFYNVRNNEHYDLSIEMNAAPLQQSCCVPSYNYL